jgi:hypothetical protein
MIGQTISHYRVTVLPGNFLGGEATGLHHQPRRLHAQPFDRLAGDRPVSSLNNLLNCSGLRKAAFAKSSTDNGALKCSFA